MKAALLFGALLILSVTSSMAQTAYPMTCVFDGEQNVGINPSLTQARKLLVGFGFKRGTKPASAGVEPGTCAWQDRGLYNDEPNYLAAVVNDNMQYFEIIYKGIPQLVLTPMAAPWAPQAKTRGYKITFKVYQSAPDHGMAYNFFRVYP